MILAFHSIFCAYGFWLPNDPRGSWSDFVAAWELAKFGPSTKSGTRQSVAGAEHDRRQRLAAKRALKYPPVMFDGAAARSIAMGFAAAAAESGYVVHACSVLPEHVHMVIGRCDRDIRRIVGHMKGRATQQLHADGLHPFQHLAPALARRGLELPTPWAEKGWNVFLDSAEDVLRAIEYVECNPLKEGKNRQRWTFVKPYVM